MNITLNTLFEAMQMAPARGPADEDDWKWVLRSVSNRPILRVVDDGSPVRSAESAERHDPELKEPCRSLRGRPRMGSGARPT